MSTVSATSVDPVDLGASLQAAAALQAQLGRLLQQLAECTNCAGAKTPAGKADIEAIRAKISSVEQRISHSDEASSRRRSQLSAGKVEPAASLAAAAGTVSQLRKTAGLGQVIDTFA
jgi:hypothetical protein